MFTTNDPYASRSNLRYALSFIAAMTALSAAAADETVGLQEIVVTAQKRTESLHDVPMAISAFNAESIAKLGLQSSNELANFTPNLTYVPAGGVGSMIGIRGVVDVNFTTSTVGSVGMIVDDVALNSPVLNTFALFDLDRVEVLRGPQVTLYGRSTTGGAINVVTRRPQVSDGDNGYATVRVGNFNAVDVDAGAGMALDEKTAVRLAVVSENRDGVFNDVTLNTKAGGYERLAVRGSVSSELSDSVDLYASAFVGTKRGQSLPYKSVGLLSKPGAAACAAPAIGSGCTDISGFADNGNFSQVFGDTPNPIENIDVRGASAEVRWNAGAVRLTSITAWVRNAIARTEDSDGGPAPIAEVSEDAVTKQFSQEFRLASSDDKAPLRWLLGALYMNETQQGDTARVSRLTSDISPPIAFTALGFDQSDRLHSAYGQVDWRFADRWTVTLGGRYAGETKSGTAERLRTFAGDTSRFPAIGTNISLGVAEQIGDPAFTQFIPFDRTWNNAGGKIGLDFAVTQDTLLYGSLSRGFKGGTFNFAAATLFRGPPGAPLTLSAFQQGVDPEKLTTYELGAKTRLFDRRVEINAALFYNDYKDQQVFGFDATGSLVLRNAAASLARGAEVEVKWLPLDTLLVQLGAGYINGHYKHFVLDDSVTPAVVADGSRMVLTPEVTGNALVRKTWRLDAGDLSLQAAAAYTGNQYFEAGEPPQTYQTAHTTYDARLGFSYGLSGKYDVAVFGKNLSDKRFCLNSSSLPWGQAQCSPNDPRTYGLSFSAKL